MNSKFLELALVFGILIVLVSGFAPVWTQTSAPTNTTWLGIAASADGKIICAISSTARPLLSTNSGGTWATNVASPSGYTCVAASADGTKLAASLFMGGGIHIGASADSGNTWPQTNTPNADWRSVASSADGVKLVAAIKSGLIYLSTNSGTTWVASSAPNKVWVAVASSTDGSKLAAAASGDKIYVSTNSGLTWAATTAPSTTWSSMACSADGKQLIASSGTSIYVSTNSGGNWSSMNPNVGTVAMSADGTKLIIAGRLIYTSDDSGNTWTSNSVPDSWGCVTVSADGNEFIAANNGSSPSKGIWIGRSTPSPQLNATVSSGNLALSWLVPSTNFVLQQNSNLSTANWAALTNVPALNLTNLQNQIILSPSNQSGFFRLSAQ